MEELTDFVMKNTSTLPSLANKHFNSLRDENKNTYDDEYIHYFNGQIIKGGRCVASNQYYKSIISDNVLNIMSEELNV